MEKTDRVNQLRTIMVTFAIAIPDGVEMHVMKMLTNVLMEHTAVLTVANVSMKKESFYDKKGNKFPLNFFNIVGNIRVVSIV